MYFKTSDNKLYWLDDSDVAEWEKTLPTGSVQITDEEAQTISITQQAAMVPAVPQVVTRFQLRAALLDGGLLASADMLMAGPTIAALTKLAWIEAPEFQRTGQTLMVLAQILSLTDSAMDQLCIAAAKIQA